MDLSHENETKPHFLCQYFVKYTHTNTHKIMKEEEEKKRQEENHEVCTSLFSGLLGCLLAWGHYFTFYFTACILLNMENSKILILYIMSNMYFPIRIKLNSLLVISIHTFRELKLA